MANDKPVIALDSAFKFGAVDPVEPARKVPQVGVAVDPNAGLGPLEPMLGTWAGHGFNTIFRPLNPSSPQDKKTFPVPVTGDNVLELNLTSESTTFSAINGEIPNRGMIQADIELSGMVYLQQISDVTSLPATGIHIEPGIWIVIPTATDPTANVRVTRMASIPHGTTVNAQGETSIIHGPPTIPPVSITPSLIAPPGSKITFPSQTVANLGTPRIPQDLTSFIAAETITQAMLDDPNTVLRNAIAHQKIISTTAISVSTVVTPPVLAGGGVDNIQFLVNTGPDVVGGATGPNAQTLQMSATFWIETVQQQITLPPFKPGGPPVHVPLRPAMAGRPAPELVIDPGRELTAARVITLEFKQIQYSQTVILNFNGLSWPHVSVATLVPSTTLTVPSSAWA